MMTNGYCGHTKTNYARNLAKIIESGLEGETPILFELARLQIFVAFCELSLLVITPIFLQEHKYNRVIEIALNTQNTNLC